MHERDPRLLSLPDGRPLVEPSASAEVAEALALELQCEVVSGPVDRDLSTWLELPGARDQLVVVRGDPLPADLPDWPLSLRLGSGVSPEDVTVAFRSSFGKKPHLDREARQQSLEKLCAALLWSICSSTEWPKLLAKSIGREPDLKVIRRRLAAYLRHACTADELCAPFSSADHRLQWIRPERRAKSAWEQAPGRVAHSLPACPDPHPWDEDLPPESELPDDSDACDRFIEQARDAGLAAAYAWAKKTFIHGYSPRMLVAVAFTKARKQTGREAAAGEVVERQTASKATCSLVERSAEPLGCSIAGGQDHQHEAAYAAAEEAETTRVLDTIEIERIELAKYPQRSDFLAYTWFKRGASQLRIPYSVPPCDFSPTWQPFVERLDFYLRTLDKAKGNPAVIDEMRAQLLRLQSEAARRV